jgi:hypothetical protein
MPIELTAALIAVVGVFGSALVSYFISGKQALIETQKLRTELQAALGGKLYEKRLETYPHLYAHISRLGKSIKGGTVTRTAIEQCFEAFQEWDSEHAILFGAGTGKLAYRLDKTLRETAAMADEELAITFASEANLKSFRRRLEEFELALKYELGTYHFESPTSLREAEQFSSYIEAQGFRGLSKPLPSVQPPFNRLAQRSHSDEDA